MNIFKNGVGRPSNNIKRARVIIAVIAVILSATIGYALFSQEVKVTGTATASGTFQITPTCLTTTSEFKNILSSFLQEAIEGGSTFGDVPVIDEGVNSSSCTVSNGNVIYSASLAYPSAMSAKFIEFKNTGTIDATTAMDDIEWDKTYCKIVNGVENCNWDGKAFNDKEGNNYALDMGVVILAIKDKNGTVCYSTNDCIDNYTDEEGYIRVKVGNSIIVAVFTKWNEKSGAEGNNLNYKGQIEIEVPFLQAN